MNFRLFVLLIIKLFIRLFKDQTSLEADKYMSFIIIVFFSLQSNINLLFKCGIHHFVPLQVELLWGPCEGKDLQYFLTLIWASQDILTDVTRILQASLISLETGSVLSVCIPGLSNVNDPKQLNANTSQHFSYVMDHISNHKLAKMHDLFTLFFA